MSDSKKTKAELISELETLRSRILDLEQSETERKRAEEALKESEERYRTLVDNSLTGIYVRRAEKIEFANKRLAEMLGYSLEELKEMPFLDFLHPEDRETARERAAARMSGLGSEAYHQYRAVTKNGDILHVEMFGVPIEYRGKPAILGHVHDITERKKIGKALREREEQYRILFETVGDVVYSMDRDFRVLSVSPSVEAFLGYRPDEIIGRKLAELDLLAPEFLEKAFADVSRVMAGEQFAPSEYEFIAKDGTRKLAEVRAASLYEGDEAVAIIAVIRDITEHRRLEQQLLQAQKMESIGTLAGGVAHDFNNILGGILGYASFMKVKITKDHPFFNYIDTIEKGAVRASELTAQLLAFARGGKYDTRPVNLNKVVDETLKLIGETFDKSIEIETRLMAELPTVEADAGQMQQVLMNLCINAADAMPAGGRLTLATGVETLSEELVRRQMDTPPGPYAVLSVTDTGKGMDRKTARRIFEPFFTTKEEGKGTGLGLSMVYGVVKNHGGSVHVDTIPGRGTTFKIYLPASTKPEAEEPAEVESLSGGNECILVVDDEEPIRAMARDLLESYGYRVLLAENGLEAIDIYAGRKDDIALVILDMIMPKMGGRKAFLKLKELDPGVKALLSTGYSQDGKAQEILESGVIGYIQKPYQINKLLAKVRSVLDANRQP